MNDLDILRKVAVDNDLPLEAISENTGFGSQGALCYWVSPEDATHIIGFSVYGLKKEIPLNFLGKLGWLERIFINDCNLHTCDASLFQNPERIKSLDFSSNQIEMVEGLAGLKNLEDLNLSDNRISNIAKMTWPPRLQTLDLGHNRLKEFSVLERLEKLNTLFLNRNRIRDLNPFLVPTSLRELDLNGNQIESLGPLENQRQIEVLFLSYNLIGDLSPLARFHNLTRLELIGNHIEALDPLQSLTNLNILALGHNQIRNLKPLAKLKQLIRLTLQKNRISDIRPLAELLALTHLWLNQNQVTELDHLIPLKNLTTLNLKENPFTKIPSELINHFERFDLGLLTSTSRGSFGLSSDHLVSPPAAVIRKGKQALDAYFNEQKQNKENR